MTVLFLHPSGLLVLFWRVMSSLRQSGSGVGIFGCSAVLTIVVCGERDVNRLAEWKAELRKGNYYVLTVGRRQQQGLIVPLSSWAPTYLFTCIIHLWWFTYVILKTTLWLYWFYHHSYIFRNPGTGKWSRLCKVVPLKSIVFWFVLFLAGRRRTKSL